MDCFAESIIIVITTTTKNMTLGNQILHFFFCAFLIHLKKLFVLQVLKRPHSPFL